MGMLSAGTMSFRVFQVSSSVSNAINFTLNNVTVRNGNAGFVGFGAAINMSIDDCNYSRSLNINDSAFIGNRSTAGTSGSGGAVYTKIAGPIRISNSTFSGNSSDNGGAITLDFWRLYQHQSGRTDSSDNLE